MGVSTEIKVHMASLGNKLQSGIEANYNFIKALEDQVIRLVGNVQSDKTGGTTGHMCYGYSHASYRVCVDARHYGVCV